MRRSAAPSVFGITKKPRFVVPYASTPAVGEKENVSLPKNTTEPSRTTIIGNAQSVQCARSTEDVLKLLSNPHLSECGEGEDSGKSETVGTSCPNKTETSPSFANEQHEIHSGNECFIKKNCMSSITTKPFQEEFSSCTGSSDGKNFTPATDILPSTLYYSVVWCKRSMKKHKKWEGDAILIIEGRSAILKDMEGKEIGRGIGYKSKEVNDLEEGSTFYVGGKECEIQNQISCQDFLSGKCFQLLGDNSTPAPHFDSKKS